MFQKKWLSLKCVHANIYKKITESMSIHFSFFTYQKMIMISQKFKI
jgi:hypothetical protein